MPVTINASTSSGLITTPDNSGQIAFQNNGVTELTVTSTGISVADNLSFNSGYGSSAVAYGCRAWVNFNGTGTVAIRASGNVSSITDNGTGNYTVNFTTALVDANYSVTATGSDNQDGTWAGFGIYDSQAGVSDPTTTSVRLITNIAFDPLRVCVAIFR